MAAVAVAVERVGIGIGGVDRRVVAVGVVVVTHEVVATLHPYAEPGLNPVCGVEVVLGLGRFESGGGALAVEVGVGVVDAGVDDRHLDARARVAGVLPHLRHAKERHADRVVDGVHRCLGDRLHPVQLRHCPHLRPRQGGPHAVVGGLHLRQHLAAAALDLGLDPVLRLLQPGANLGGSSVGQRTRLGLDDGDGVAGQFDHDGHLGVLVGVAGDEFRIDLALRRCVVEAIDPGVGVGDGGHRQGKCARGDE